MSDDFANEYDAESTLPPRRRRPSTRKSVYTRPLNTGRLVITLLFVAGLLAGGTFYRQHKNTRYAVIIGKKQVVYVAGKAEAQQVITEVKDSFAPGHPDAVTFKQGKLGMQAVTKSVSLTKRPVAVKTLRSKLTPIVDGVAIFVDGRPRVALASKEDAGRAIALMQQRGLGDQQGVPTIKQRVTIASYQYVAHNKAGVELMTAEKAAEFLVHPAVPRTYTVQSGDSFWSISNAHGLTVKQIKALNPNVDPARLKKGDLIKLPSIPSPVTIIVRRQGK